MAGWRWERERGFLSPRGGRPRGSGPPVSAFASVPGLGSPRLFLPAFFLCALLEGSSSLLLLPLLPRSSSPLFRPPSPRVLAGFALWPLGSPRPLARIASAPRALPPFVPPLPSFFPPFLPPSPPPKPGGFLPSPLSSRPASVDRPPPLSPPLPLARPERGGLSHPPSWTSRADPQGGSHPLEEGRRGGKRPWARGVGVEVLPRIWTTPRERPRASSRRRPDERAGPVPPGDKLGGKAV